MLERLVICIAISTSVSASAASADDLFTLEDGKSYTFVVYAAGIDAGGNVGTALQAMPEPDGAESTLLLQ